MFILIIWKIVNLILLQYRCSYNYLFKPEKMKYSIISNEKRAILLDRVFKNKEPVKLVALELKLKLPSAKSIVRTYKKTGRIFNKKKTRKSKTRNS